MPENLNLKYGLRVPLPKVFNEQMKDLGISNIYANVKCLVDNENLTFVFEKDCSYFRWSNTYEFGHVEAQLIKGLKQFYLALQPYNLNKQNFRKVEKIIN